MTLFRRLALAAMAATLLSGCSMLNNLTGQTDNTVLPGTREDAVPGHAQYPEKNDSLMTPDKTGASPATSGTSGSAGNADAYCAPNDKTCKPPATTGDTFKDPQ